jgi:hypothetical protein
MRTLTKGKFHLFIYRHLVSLDALDASITVTEAHIVELGIVVTMTQGALLRGLNLITPSSIDSRRREASAGAREVTT